MPKKVSRRNFIKRLFSGALALGSVGIGGYYYANEIEPRLLDVTQYKLKHSSIPKDFNGFRIIQFSDTHLGFHYNLAQFQKLIKKINDLQPDLIVFTGDLLDHPTEFNQVSDVTKILSNLNSRYGKFAVYGNHDHGGYGTDIYKEIIINSGFTLLVNDSKPITLPNGNSIYLLGIDDAMLGQPDIKAALQNTEEQSYKILLSHAPDLAETTSLYPIQLQLSGHSHGGQIQLPFYGPVVTPPFGEKYPEGFYLLGTHNELTLYVNRGIGTTRLPFRMFSKPELTLFTLSSELNEQDVS
ncbi:metallophosphoesterase [Mesobacillus maritimus]|uniref:metallophosphoesterase n=1 Tax=Mesobacillus maritimus TaxID=1643336 RepID=UPI00203D6617|nr:metallophosphoesterase [Mesobacillus maritimus]MCM3667576.1 metallophosphoesterase [Mesobacillus maritimus]